MQHPPGNTPASHDKLWRHLLTAFLIAVAVYAAAFFLIEKRRVVHTPWVVSYETAATGETIVEVRQESRGLGPATIKIPSPAPVTPLTRTNVVFGNPQPVPRAMPVGTCVFEDLTFLPGTVVLRVHGVEIQMLPRALTVNTNEFSWATREISVNEPPRTDK